MKSKLHYALLGATTLTLMYACSPKTGQMATTTGKNTETPAGKRKFIDPVNMNMSAKPSEDFYEYANGAWLKTAKIPASESRWGSFNELQEFNQNALKAICEDASAAPGAKGTTRQKVGDFYAAGMDEAAIEKMGLAGVKPLLDRVMKIKSYKELLEEITNLYMDGDDPLWSLAVDQDDKNSTAVVPKFYQGGIHLPDRDYFLKDDERSKKIRKAYEEHAYNVFKLLGDNEVKAKANAGDVMRFESIHDTCGNA
jgi:putative endopeptidase